MHWEMTYYRNALENDLAQKSINYFTIEKVLKRILQ